MHSEWTYKHVFMWVIAGSLILFLVACTPATTPTLPPATVVESSATPTLTPLPSETPTPDFTATPAFSPTPSPTLRPTPVPTEQRVLYQTNFADDDASLQQWQNFAYSMNTGQFESEGFVVKASNHIYRFKPSQTNQRIFSIYQPDLGDNVDLTLKEPVALDNGYPGLVCRYTPAGWYQFMIEPGGIWSMRMAKYDQQKKLHFYILSTGNIWFGSNNILGAECNGDRLSLKIDGEVVAMIHDSSFPSGKVGLLGWSFDQANQESWIGQFTVQRVEDVNPNFTGPSPTPDADNQIYTTDFSDENGLTPYWNRIDAGIELLPGDNNLIGPGSSYNLHMFRYINDYDPGTGVNLSADLNSFSQGPRGLICRYSEEGWYQLHYWPRFGSIGLVRYYRDNTGKMIWVFLGDYTLPEPTTKFNLSLTCAGNTLTAQKDGQTVITATDDFFNSGKYGLFFIGQLPGYDWQFFKNYTVSPAVAVFATSTPVPTPSQTPTQTPTLLPSEADATGADDIAALLGLAPDDSQITSKDKGLSLKAAEWIGKPLVENETADTRMNVDFTFLDKGFVLLSCHKATNDEVWYEIHSEGNWVLYRKEQVFKQGGSPAISAARNQAELDCHGAEIQLKVNNEVVDTTQLDGYVAQPGQTVFTVPTNIEVLIAELGYKVFRETATVPVAAVTAVPTPTGPLNRVSIVEYAPGQTIYSWNLDDFARPSRDSIWAFWSRDINPQVDGEWVTLEKPREFAGEIFGVQTLDYPVQISADMEFRNKQGGLGLICRINNFGRYEFVIQANGAWMIRRNANYWFDQSAKGFYVLASGNAEAITNGENVVQATCAGDQLILTVNGTVVGRTTDDAYPEGKVGLLFNYGVSAAFKDVTVTIPQE